MRRFNCALWATLACASLLGGCGFVHRHFGHNNDDVYKQAVNEHPLEVPPDLDKPAGTAALSIPPAASGSGASAGTSTAATDAAETGSSAPDTAAAASTSTGETVALSGEGLQVIDTLDSTWSRVGLALAHSGAANVLDRDESAHLYTVETTGRTTAKKAGLFKRIVTFGRAGRQTTGKVQLRVRVAPDGANSRVSIEGADNDASRDAARALLQTIRDRMS